MTGKSEPISLSVTSQPFRIFHAFSGIQIAMENASTKTNPGNKST